jgi:hypothetical protein
MYLFKFKYIHSFLCVDYFSVDLTIRINKSFGKLNFKFRSSRYYEILHHKKVFRILFIKLTFTYCSSYFYLLLTRDKEYKNISCLYRNPFEKNCDFLENPLILFHCSVYNKFRNIIGRYTFFNTKFNMKFDKNKESKSK